MEEDWVRVRRGRRAVVGSRAVMHHSYISSHSFSFKCMRVANCEEVAASSRLAYPTRERRTHLSLIHHRASMSVTLYDLVPHRGPSAPFFSPACIRARLALAHKGIAIQTQTVTYHDLRTVWKERLGVEKATGDLAADKQFVGWLIFVYLVCLQRPSSSDQTALTSWTRSRSQSKFEPARLLRFERVEQLTDSSLQMARGSLPRPTLAVPATRSAARQRLLTRVPSRSG